MTQELTRREFMAAAGGAVGLTLQPDARLSPVRPEPPRAGTVVLFQGDSITDTGRSREHTGANEARALGSGYPLLVAAGALRDHPERGLRFLNRGISGNKVPDLQARWKADTVDLKPDVLSILIGVNDIWHRKMGNYRGTVRDFEAGYTALLENTRRALPGTRLVVMEPFVLRVHPVDAGWYPEFDQRRDAAARVAERVGAAWVPLQDMFDGLAARGGAEYWLPDGVHPSLAGHEAIARRWREVVGI